MKPDPNSEKSNFNVPNVLTVFRILLVPFFIYFLFREEIFYNIIAFIIFCLASLTDLIDGYLARKWNQTTEFGKFLDPLADKVLVIGAFATLLVLNEQVETWMIFLIILRDMLITSLRYIGILQGKIVQTTQMAKLKTFFQMGAIVIILMLLMIISSGQKNKINQIYSAGRDNGKIGLEIAGENYHLFISNFRDTAPLLDHVSQIAAFLPYYIMLITTIITVLSGLRYLVSNRELLNLNNIWTAYREKNE
ncbi:MAG: CDP-diacylglycerol--glycerol-3-phosphate 3-phosphatidyltransferase [Leptospiraceae bacterium]|nr:CDP-diacylglycerol--glycerol-3-phosphate 3-phosphatidyltransferase [Leptospiraceae bacterium]MCP5511724.1 CDP-diacylglycerol--glycerol-3-phosphate 3-phosphatidyltransferase [Leptospiraceae bacterium]